MEVSNKEEDVLDVFNTKWYKDIRRSISPRESLKIYRENLGFSQIELGKKIGKFNRQKISDMETGKRGISKDVARKLSNLFDVSINRFI
ncbi:MAG: helix-turn-helix transcriptional regulator [Candidatus Anammoxibacter sp.]